ncbi:peptide chain release factor-like protein [Patescibacteria group bacterium]
MYKTDLRTLREETKVETFMSSGPGGQRRDRKENAVRLHHLPSGIMVIASERRSQVRNIEVAFRRLQKRLEEINKPKKPRIPTRPSFAARERRIEEKKEQSKKKERRRVPRVD